MFLTAWKQESYTENCCVETVFAESTVNAVSFSVFNDHAGFVRSFSMPCNQTFDCRSAAENSAFAVVEHPAVDGVISVYNNVEQAASVSFFTKILNNDVFACTLTASFSSQWCYRAELVNDLCLCVSTAAKRKPRVRCFRSSQAVKSGCKSTTVKQVRVLRL